jgi:hypothetical protein
VMPVDMTGRRSLWRIHRPVEGPLSILFRGMADPTWNHGQISTLRIGLDLSQAPAKDGTLTVWINVLQRQGERVRYEAVKPFGPEDRELIISLDDFPDLPTGTAWRQVWQIEVLGHIAGNRFELGPICKR